MHEELLRLEFEHYDVDKDETISGMDFARSVLSSVDLATIDTYLDRAAQLPPELAKIKVFPYLRLLHNNATRKLPGSYESPSILSKKNNQEQMPPVLLTTWTDPKMASLPAAAVLPFAGILRFRRSSSAMNLRFYLMQITYEQFRHFASLYQHVHTLAVALHFFHNLQGQLMPDDFKRATKIVTGNEITDELVNYLHLLSVAILFLLLPHVSNQPTLKT